MVRVARFEKVSLRRFVTDWVATFPQQTVEQAVACLLYTSGISMAKPLVAVVGRPNVGKSTFFNKIAGRRISIVEDTPGVTRDRIYADCEWLNHKFTLIDTCLLYTSWMIS